MVVGQNLHGGDHMIHDSDTLSQINLKGKIALVVGGSGSIGRGISQRLFEAGADLIIVSRNIKKNLSNKKKIYIPMDASKEKNVKDVYNWVIKKYKRIDILILANGIQNRRPFNKIKLDEWNDILANNLTSVFLICKYFTKSMIKNNYGKIVGITSLTSFMGIRNISAYGASKGGMTQFLKSISIELADSNITVNMVSPGRIDTSMTSDLIINDELNKLIKSRIPMNRYGSVNEISGAVLFLVSNLSNYMTGQSIIIDGGWLSSGGNSPA